MVLLGQLKFHIILNTVPSFQLSMYNFGRIVILLGNLQNKVPEAVVLYKATTITHTSWPVRIAWLIDYRKDVKS